MKKIGIVVFSMSRVGGTERVVNILARRLSEEYSVTIFELENSAGKESIFVNDAVDVVSFFSPFKNHYINIVFSMLNVARYVYKERFDVVYSTFGNVNILAILLLFFTKVVICDHVCYHVGMKGFFGKVRKCLYRLADTVISLTEHDKKKYDSIKCNTIVIENPLPANDFIAQPFQDSRKLIAVGRLSNAKNFFRLIDVAKKLKSYIPDFDLTIYGDGELLLDLSDYIKLSGLTENVTIHKPIQNISSVYAEAGLLLMTSDYEALPMTLIEAQAMGLPCIAFDIETGPKEIIVDGKTGFLIPNNDLNLYVDKVVELLGSVELRRRMYNLSIEYSKRYDIEKVYLKWKALIDA